MTRGKPGRAWHPENNMTNRRWHLKPAVAVKDVMTIKRVIGIAEKLKTFRCLCGQAVE